MKELAAAWVHTVRPLAPAADVVAVGADLLSRYAEQHRHYHGIAHLQFVLGNVDELAVHAVNSDLVRLAAWFHDAIYDPRADDSEAASAQLATTALTDLGVERAAVDEVRRLVCLTAAHQPENVDRNGVVLCDADLAILAVDHGTYSAYVEGVRREYGHLDDAAFRDGRAGVLRRLLARDRLFGTSTAYEKWEQRARQNMATELSALVTG